MHKYKYTNTNTQIQIHITRIQTSWWCPGSRKTTRTTQCAGRGMERMVFTALLTLTTISGWKALKRGKCRDYNLKFRPFGGPPVPWETYIGWLKSHGILFSTMLGIGQKLVPK